MQKGRSCHSKPPVGVAFRSLPHWLPSSRLPSGTLPSFPALSPLICCFSSLIHTISAIMSPFLFLKHTSHQPPGGWVATLLSCSSICLGVFAPDVHMAISLTSFKLCSIVTFSVKSSHPPTFLTSQMYLPIHPHTPKAPFLLKFIP